MNVSVLRRSFAAEDGKFRRRATCTPETPYMYMYTDELSVSFIGLYLYTSVEKARDEEFGRYSLVDDMCTYEGSLYSTTSPLSFERHEEMCM